MLKGVDVPRAMTRVKGALARRGSQPQASAPIIMSGGDEFGISALTAPAVLETEFPPGSSKRFAPLVIFIKKALRKSLRWYIVPVAEQQSRFNLAVLDIHDRFLGELSAFRSEVGQMRKTIDLHVGDTEKRLDLLRSDMEQLSQGTAQVDGEESSIQMLPSAREDLEYRAFEDRHRGSFDDIRKLLAIYLPHFKGRRRVLDIGCGRGEFLEMLKEENIASYGVDLDEGMVEAARARGVEAYAGDAIAHLRTLNPGDIDGIFSSQVAEHLRTSDLLTMVDLCYRKLAPGGVIVIETPNPETLFIFHAFFYVDLTHIKPIHPEAMKWTLEAAGFRDVQIERILPVPKGARLDRLPEDAEDTASWRTMASNIERLNNLLYGPQHFAAIARKLH